MHAKQKNLPMDVNDETNKKTGITGSPSHKQNRRPQMVRHPDPQD